MDMVLGFDLDAITTEEIECVFRKRAVEHREDFGRDVVDCDLDVRN